MFRDVEDTYSVLVPVYRHAICRVFSNCKCLNVQVWVNATGLTIFNKRQCAITRNSSNVQTLQSEYRSTEIASSLLCNITSLLCYDIIYHMILNEPTIKLHSNSLQPLITQFKSLNYLLNIY